MTAPKLPPPPEPVAWYVERVAPGMRDNGTRLGPFWWRPLAEEWCDERHELHSLHTADQMLAMYRQGLEDAAKVCDAIEQGALPDGSGAAGLAWECADAISAKAKEIT